MKSFVDYLEMASGKYRSLGLPKDKIPIEYADPNKKEIRTVTFLIYNNDGRMAFTDTVRYLKSRGIVDGSHYTSRQKFKDDTGDNSQSRGFIYIKGKKTKLPTEQILKIWDKYEVNSDYYDNEKQ